MVEGFEQTGDFRKISNAPDLSEIIGDILEIDSTEMQVCDGRNVHEKVELLYCCASYTYFSLSRNFVKRTATKMRKS